MHGLSPHLKFFGGPSPQSPQVSAPGCKYFNNVSIRGPGDEKPIEDFSSPCGLVYQRYKAGSLNDVGFRERIEMPTKYQQAIRVSRHNGIDSSLQPVQQLHRLIDWLRRVIQGTHIKVLRL